MAPRFSEYIPLMQSVIDRPFNIKKLGLQAKDNQAWNQALGAYGEELALCYLKKIEKIKPLFQNFKSPNGGEVDIVARDLDTLAFIEVKTRMSINFGRGIEAVNPAKRRLIIRGATHWLRLLDFPSIHYRFDVLEVGLQDGEKPHLIFTKNAFQTPKSLMH